MEHYCTAISFSGDAELSKIYDVARTQRQESGQEATFFPIAVFQAGRAALGAERPTPRQLEAVHAGVVCAIAGCTVNLHIPASSQAA